MRHLLNTLFILSEDIYLSLENGNIVAWRDGQAVQKLPLLNLENILYFGYRGASPALLGACAKRHIGFCFLTPNGRFLARVCGASSGNVFLRKAQYHISDDEMACLPVDRAIIMAKIYNARLVAARALRDHPLSVDQDKFQEGLKLLKSSVREAARAGSVDELRGIEGNAAHVYFQLFPDMILTDKKKFHFQGRNKRPPLDPVNALLSFTYTLLAHDYASALEAVGLDSYVGFMHTDRPGRVSLALDLMEEMRNLWADRFVLTLINNRIITPAMFRTEEDGAVLLKDEGKKLLLQNWQDRKRDTLQHPFLEEKIPRGLIPCVQSLLLARYIRGDLDGYPAFLGR